MPKILAVHGIGQQFKSDAILHSEYWPALLDGLKLAAAQPSSAPSDPNQVPPAQQSSGQHTPSRAAAHPFTNAADLVCPFYGHLFRNPDSLVDPVYEVADIGPHEQDLLLALWDAATLAEPGKIPARSTFDDGDDPLLTPGWVQRALNALSKTRFLEKFSRRLIINDLKQVTRYLGEPQLRESILQVVLESLTPDVEIVIGHSLGSVVAYECLCRNPGNVRTFITLGSPLGLRDIVFDRLTPKPSETCIGSWPGVRDWINIADAADILAAQKRLAPRFSEKIRDIFIVGGADIHRTEAYLSSIETGKAILQSL